jgi:CRISPR-associated protein Csb2
MIRRDAPKLTVARFRLDAPVLPLVTETLPLAEKVRRTLLGKCKSLASGNHPTPPFEAYPAIWGKDAHGQPLHGHEHAFFLPTDEDHDGRLDHLTIFAPMGFNPLERHALNRLRQLYSDDAEPLHLLLTGLGTALDIRSPLLEPATVWQSATPFLVTRHPKMRGTKRDQPEDYASPQSFVRHILLQELRRRPNTPEVVSVEEQLIGVQQRRPIEFKRFRAKASDDGGRRPAAGFRVTFAAPVYGPLCLGHSCHFGLGLFLPSSAAVRDSSITTVL